MIVNDKGTNECFEQEMTGMSFKISFFVQPGNYSWRERPKDRKGSRDMKLTRCILTVIVGVVSVLGSVVAFADCPDGIRKGTPAEEAYYQKVQAAIKEVLPPAPAEWTFTPMQDRTLGILCKGTPEGGFSVTVEAKYTYRPSKEKTDLLNAENRKISSEINSLEKLPPELNKERNDLLAKYSEKTRAASQAEKDGNKELARNLYAERESFRRQANDVRERHLASVKPKLDELRKRQQGLFTGRQEVVLRVTANGQYPEKLTPGQESEIIVGKVPGPRSPGLKVHGIRVLLRGPTEKREEILSLVDKTKMEKALQ